MSEPRTQVRTYPGRTEAEASALLADDDAPMAAAGYTLSSQSWAESMQYGPTSKILLAVAVGCTAAGWLIAWPFSIAAMVLLVLGMMTRTRTGALTATWTETGTDGPVAKPGETSAAARRSSGPSTTA